MLATRTLLAERFNLKVHRAARRGAPPPAPGTGPICGMQSFPGRVRFVGYPSLFASLISNKVGRMVVDRTGLTGNRDFELTYAPPPS